MEANLDIKIYQAKAQAKKGWASWFLKNGSKKLPGYFYTKQVAIATRNEIIRARNVESAISKHTYDEVSQEVVDRYKKRFEAKKIKYTSFNDAGQAQRFWSKYFTKLRFKTSKKQSMMRFHDELPRLLKTDGLF